MVELLKFLVSYFSIAFTCTRCYGHHFISHYHVLSYTPLEDVTIHFGHHSGRRVEAMAYLYLWTVVVIRLFDVLLLMAMRYSVCNCMLVCSDFIT